MSSEAQKELQTCFKYHFIFKKVLAWLISLKLQLSNNNIKIIQSREKPNTEYENHRIVTVSYHETLVPPTAYENSVLGTPCIDLQPFTDGLTCSHLLCRDHPVRMCRKA